MKRTIILAGVTLAVIAGGLWFWTDQPANWEANAKSIISAVPSDEAAADGAVATLAGGCFWCVESTLEKLDGVTEVVSGYTGGDLVDPTYRQVGGGGTGHTEAVQVYYQPDVISYEELLHHFWREIDPTDKNGQFVDRGDMYRPAIYYHNDREKMLAEASRDALEESGRFDKPIMVEITAAQPFYKAEGYHQDYYKKSAYRYKVYRYGSGRDQFLEKVWGDEIDEKQADEAGADLGVPSEERYSKPDDSTLKERLTNMQYRVTQHEGTEPPFNNEYWDNKAEGIYVDIVSGEPLFSSTDKYRSGTGWPSFSKPIDEQYMVEKTDYKLLFPRTELRSKYADSHLGHVFSDGPAPTGLRYCINSASLRFVAKSELSDKGYEKYMSLFQ